MERLDFERENPDFDVLTVVARSSGMKWLSAKRLKFCNCPWRYQKQFMLIISLSVTPDFSRVLRLECESLAVLTASKRRESR